MDNVTDGVGKRERIERARSMTTVFPVHVICSVLPLGEYTLRLMGMAVCNVCNARVGGVLPLGEYTLRLMGMAVCNVCVMLV